MAQTAPFLDVPTLESLMSYLCFESLPAKQLHNNMNRKKERHSCEDIELTKLYYYAFEYFFISVNVVKLFS